MCVFREGTPIPQQDDAMRAIAGWAEVTQVARLDPETGDELFRRFSYVVVAPAFEAEAVVQRLRELEPVESADVAAERGMAAAPPALGDQWSDDGS